MRHTVRTSLIGLATALLLTGAAGCGDDNSQDGANNGEPDAYSAPDWEINRMFPSQGATSKEFEGCLYSSPMPYERDGATEIVALGAEGTLAGLDPDTGAELWSLELPTPDGEGVLSIAQPAFIDEHRILIAYHSVPGSAEEVDPNTRRLTHRVAVVDLQNRQVDPAFGDIALEATVDGNDDKTVSFDPAYALIRPDVEIGKVDGDTFGKAYITSGNARDIQPWHGWAFEIDVDAWHEQGADASVSSVLVTTPEPAENCGPEGSSGSRERLCGGGLWAPSGPLVLDQPGGYELVLAPGNGQLDLARNDYANTLMRTGPGLDFDPACDPDACADFDSDAPSNACIESCENLWIPRLTGQDDEPPQVWDNRCDGLTLFECWQQLDYIGGSTPAYVEVGEYKTLNYPTKDGHLYMVDQTHYGTQFDRLKLVENCGTADDPCRWTWAGMAVTEPVVAWDGDTPIIMTPTFMPDKTHPAGVVATTIRATDDGPVYERLWEFPSFDTDAATERFRRHPSRMTLSTLGDEGRQIAWIVDIASGPDNKGQLVAIDVLDGTRVFETTLGDRGRRYTVPLVVDDRVYVSSCSGDFGPGHVEGFQITREDSGAADGGL
ncbi:hypothetical protein FIV42_21255 [Persicimonas caeni]|uniref:PQQ-binding-like beta-propeller repeat protein n=1 Tax=Persicimonas caeni TaxID=2292766 RepID=A0A4Y6PYE7_PERCE|nr:hypothetical protein [Persicimonas caeni]QDG53179.1 hypothetical protein FIV42_21255 [Persicimonas caeni]QED34401.1 hypothetical protein FRD00_21250 [Persicimonas caeni]